jgi:hypothetical protein
MNIIVDTKPDAQKEFAEPQAKPAISPEERARRKAGVDYARGSMRLSGFILSPFAEDLNRRYIDGEISREEMSAALFAHHKR